MKTKWNKKKELILLLIALLPIVALLLFNDKVADQVPMHWNFKGEIDAYGSKWITPLLTVGFYFFFLLLMFIDPKKGNYDRFSSLIYKIRLSLSLLFSAISGISLYIGMGNTFAMDRFLLITLPMLFCFLGNSIISIKPNWFMGVRTPWTMESENVWRKTHRLTGMLWFWSGLIMAILGFFIPTTYGFILLISLISILVLLPIVYSYLEYKKEKRGY